MMHDVSKIINDLINVYFSTENTAERYNIFSKVEDAMKEARKITTEKIISTGIISDDVNLLIEMTEIVDKIHGKHGAVLTRETTFEDLSDMGVDYLNLIEIAIEFEDILGINIDQTPPALKTSIGDLLNLRK